MDVLKEFDIEKDIVQVLQTRRLTYFGHVNRMQSERYPRVLLHGYTHGHCPKGRPKKKWIDNVREDCSDMEISLHEASRLTLDRTSCRNTVQHMGCQRAVSSPSSQAISQVSKSRSAYFTDFLYASCSAAAAEEVEDALT